MFRWRTILRRYAYDWIVWAALLSVPAVVFWQIKTSLAEQEVASGGPLENAAIFPAIIGWVLVALCGIQAARLIWGRVGQASPLKRTPTTPAALMASALFVAFLLSLSWLGYYVAVPLLMVALMMLFGVRVFTALIFAAILTVAVAFIFEGLLNVVLPLGPWKFTLFG